MTNDDIQRLRKLADSMRGRFFYDEERGDIGYIAAECDAKECDCERKGNADGDQDCSYSVADVGSSDVDDIGPVLAEMLNALRPLLDRLEAVERERDGLRALVERAIDACEAGGRRVDVFAEMDAIRKEAGL